MRIFTCLSGEGLVVTNFNNNKLGSCFLFDEWRCYFLQSSLCLKSKKKTRKDVAAMRDQAARVTARMN